MMWGRVISAVVALVVTCAAASPPPQRLVWGHHDPPETLMEFVEAHGARIPIVGFGTMRLKEEAGAQAIESAIRTGYRHLDTAAHYGNEKEVGQAIRAAGV